MSVLHDIVTGRRERVAREYSSLAPSDRERLACCARPARDFAGALGNRLDVAVIAEVKKCSPSVGAIVLDCDAGEQALRYEHGDAAAVSVLTEPDRFGGSFADLSDVADATRLPVLCKDFVVDPVQIFVARGHGADAILLMVSVLGDEVGEYLDLARTLHLGALVEVATPDELTVALRAGADLIAVNARDLRTLEVDMGRQREIVGQAARSGAVVVAASGVKRREDVEAAASAGADAVLVGETLMRAPFPEDVLDVLVGVRKEMRHA